MEVKPFICNYSTRRRVGAMENKGIGVGKKAKDFILRDQKGQEFILSEYPGRKVLLSFHPLA